jgi:hypothetical protein
MALAQADGAWLWALVAGSATCHAVQAAAYETQRQEYAFWGWNQKSAELGDLDAARVRRGKPLSMRWIMDTLYGFYVRIQWKAAGATLTSRGQLARMIERAPDQADTIRQQYRKIFAPGVRQWAILSSNYRTLGIFIAALLHILKAYFWFEIIVFGTIMIVLIGRQRHRYKLFFDGLPVDAG